MLSLYLMWEFFLIRMTLSGISGPKWRSERFIYLFVFNGGHSADVTTVCAVDTAAQRFFVYCFAMCSVTWMLTWNFACKLVISAQKASHVLSTCLVFIRSLPTKSLVKGGLRFSKGKEKEREEPLDFVEMYMFSRCRSKSCLRLIRGKSLLCIKSKKSWKQRNLCQIFSHLASHSSFSKARSLIRTECSRMEVLVLMVIVVQKS